MALMLWILTVLFAVVSLFTGDTMLLALGLLTAALGSLTEKMVR